jgi:hypothetical protein
MTSENKSLSRPYSPLCLAEAYGKAKTAGGRLPLLRIPRPPESPRKQKIENRKSQTKIPLAFDEAFLYNLLVEFCRNTAQHLGG